MFFAGGDQSNYVSRIAGRPLEALLRGKAGHVTIGGTSAGHAIQGLWIYAAFHGSITSEQALVNPYAPALRGEVVSSLLSVPALDSASVLTDSHFVTRDRMGRMITFLARIAADGYAGKRPRPTLSAKGFGVRPSPLMPTFLFAFFRPGSCRGADSWCGCRRKNGPSCRTRGGCARRRKRHSVHVHRRQRGPSGCNLPAREATFRAWRRM